MDGLLLNKKNFFCVLNIRSLSLPTLRLRVPNEIEKNCQFLNFIVNSWLDRQTFPKFSWINPGKEENMGEMCRRCCKFFTNCLQNSSLFSHTLHAYTYVHWATPIVFPRIDFWVRRLGGRAELGVFDRKKSFFVVLLLLLLLLPFSRFWTSRSTCCSRENELKMN